MRNVSEGFAVVEAIFNQAVELGVGVLTLDDGALSGREISIGGKVLTHFGSCSYLGLEMDSRLKDGAMQALQRFGTQFSSSRAYLSAAPYAELEELLGSMTDAKAMVTPTTSLGHISALPVLVQENDAVILDQQVHHSVQTAVNLVRVQGSHVEMVRHNRMDLLEERIQKLRQKHRHIWYLADGVYSMYGDLIPSNELVSLMNKYEQLRLYVDDAHGTGWYGKHGRGVFLEQAPLRERTIVTLSLNKSFAAAGGALIFPDEKTMKRVRFCGGPMTFSGPVQPPMLGAALASARIHLSEDLPTFQAELLAKIAYCNRLLTEHELPVISASEAPIRFIGMGLPRVALNLAKRLMGEGLYVNVAQFPAVPMRRAGIRFTITRHQTESDIKRLVEAIAHHLPYSLSEEGGSLEEISRAFKISLPSIPLERRIPQAKGALTLQHERTIHAFSPDKWDSLLGNNGIFSHQGLETLEQVFCGHPEPENNWDFHYYVVREADGTPVLATFFTGGLWKDDMLSPSSTSALVERSRKNDPYFLTSKTLAMGSLLSEGQHLYLDRGRNWQEAMRMLLEAVESERENQQASRVILRDLPSDDPEMDVFLLDQGFSKYPLPETAVVDVNWTSEEEYLRTLSYRSRRQQRREVLDWEQQCQIELLPKAGRPLTEAEVEHFHQLYLNVKGRNLSLNTFDLPKSLWSHLQAAPCWELLTLTVKPEYGGPSDGRPVAVTANYVGAEAYVPLIIGLDYDYAHSFHAYRQFLLQTIRRANLHGSRRIYLGFGAPLEKQRLGARLEVPAIYVQMTDHFNAEILSQLMADSFGKVG